MTEEDEKKYHEILRCMKKRGENMTEWKKFSEEWPKCKYIFVYFSDEVQLHRNDSFSPFTTTSKYMNYYWSEAEIDIPDPPTLHDCNRGYFTCHFLGGQLMLTFQLPDKDSVHTFAEFCPFCGFKP